mmetsp:Transcript_20483/g.42778  ORF Transcript_20483/g.42778 Transcript_20483/m.42778 type:complete len:474 (-) Transcript_20483:510-1931(-)
MEMETSMPMCKRASVCVPGHRCGFSKLLPTSKRLEPRPPLHSPGLLPDPQRPDRIHDLAAPGPVLWQDDGVPAGNRDGAAVSARGNQDHATLQDVKAIGALPGLDDKGGRRCRGGASHAADDRCFVVVVVVGVVVRARGGGVDPPLGLVGIVALSRGGGPKHRQLVVVDHPCRNAGVFRIRRFFGIFVFFDLRVVDDKPDLVEVLGDVPPPRPVPGNDDRVPGTKVVARPVFVRQAPKTVQEVKDRGRRGVVRRVLVRPPAPGPGGGPAGNRCSGLREHQELVVRVAGGEVLGARDRIAGVGGSRRPPARDQLLGQDVLPGGQEQRRARGFCCRGNAAGPGALSEGRGCDDDDDVVVVAAHATAPRCPGNDSGNDPRRDEGAARAAGGMAPAEALFHRGGGEFLEGIEAREVLVPAEGGELPQRWRRGVWLVAMARLVVPGRLPPRTCDRRRSKGGRTAHRKGAGLRRPGEDR